MKKVSAKVLTMLLAVAFVLIAVPVKAQAAVNPPKQITIYANSTKNIYSWNSFDLPGIKKTAKITSVKSSNNKVVKPVRISKSESKYEEISLDKSYANDYKSSGYSRGISFIAFKTGSATISYKIDGKKYSTKIKVLPYKNVVKKFTIAGGKNLASKYKECTYASDKAFTSDKKNVKIDVSAISGWKVTSIEVSNNTSGKSIRMSNYSHPKTSISYNAGNIKKGDNCSIYVYLVEKKTGRSMSISYYMNN